MADARKTLEIVISARDEASKTLNSFGAKIKNWKGDIQKAGLLMAGVSVSLLAVGKSAVSVASDLEQNRIAFETMAGSADAAGRLMQQLSDFAVKTPFDMPGVVDAGKQLMAMGSSVEEVIPDLKMLGDVAAGLGVPLWRLILNFGQVRMQGKLTGRELRDFAVAGVPLIDQLADSLGVAKDEIAGMVSEGEIKFKDVSDAFKSMTSEGGKFNDLMIEQSKSLKGVISNIRDELIRFAADIVGITTSGEIRKGSLFAVLKQGAEKLLVTVEELRPKITKFVDVLSKNKTVIAALGGALLGLFIAPMVIAIALMGHAILIAGAVVAAFGAIAAVIVETAQRIMEIKDKIQNEWIPALQNARNEAIAFKDRVIAAFGEFRQRAIEVWEGIKADIEAKWPEIKEAIKNFLRDLANSFMDFTAAALTAYDVFTGGLLTKTEIMLPQWIDAFKAYLNKAREINEGIWNEIYNKVSFQLQKILEVNQQFWPPIIEVFRAAQEQMKVVNETVWGFIVEAVEFSLEKILEVHKKFWPIVVDLFTKAQEEMRSVSERVWARITEYITGQLEKIVKTLEWFVDQYKKFAAIIDSIRPKIKIGVELPDFGAVANEIKRRYEEIRSKLPSFQHGGYVPGTIGQAVPAILHSGERVIPRTGTDVNPPAASGGVTVNLTVEGDVNSMETLENIIEGVKSALGRDNELAAKGVAV